MKILPEMYLWPRKNYLNFESNPLPDADPGIFERLFNIARKPFFHNSAHVSGKN